MQKCENPKHKGDKKKNHGQGIWWLKDPEWQYWCPNCFYGYIEKRCFPETIQEK